MKKWSVPIEIWDLTDSSSINLVGARDSETQAVFGLRGKILNLRKASLDKILANQEIVGIIKSLGLDMDSKTLRLTYDKNKLRYGKIILAADGK